MGDDNAQIEKLAELIFVLRQKCALKDMFIVRDTGISTAEYNCLMQFLGSSSTGMKELSERLGITPGGVTRIVSGLEKEGILERRISLEDRRNIDVLLTGKGEKIIKEIKKSSIELHSQIIDKIDPHQRDQVIEAVEQLIAALSCWLEQRGKADTF